MDEKGFTPFEMTEIHNADLPSLSIKIMLQVDMVFVRKESRFVQGVQQAIGSMGSPRINLAQQDPMPASPSKPETQGSITTHTTTYGSVVDQALENAEV